MESSSPCLQKYKIKNKDKMKVKEENSSTIATAIKSYLSYITIEHRKEEHTPI